MLSPDTIMKQQILQLLPEAHVVYTWNFCILSKEWILMHIRMRNLDKAKPIVGIAHNQGLPFQVVQRDINGKNFSNGCHWKTIKEKKKIDIIVDNAEYEILGSNWRVW